MIHNITDKNFSLNIKEGIQLLTFTAPWCGYCNRQKPILEELSKNNIWIGDVNGDENPHLVTKYSIQAFPSFVLFKDGKEINSFRGMRSKDELMSIINRN
ncbi:thioredoxin fold domain-containing protein [bacterium]|nr:thioredoxin fold domain-containing protein [bacterium]